MTDTHRVPAKPLEAVIDPADWRATDLAREDDWVLRLDTEDLAEIEAGLARVSGFDVIEITADNFPLERLDERLDAMRSVLLDGRGIALIKGVPVDRYSIRESAAAFWALGLRIGVPVSQNAKGHVLGHVKDLSGSSFTAESQHRGYHTSAALPWHADSCDVVGLLCLQATASGGESRIVSAVAIHNEMLKRRPDLVAELAKPWFRDRRGEIPDGKEPWWSLPVFNYIAGYLTTSWQGKYIRTAQRFAELPRFTPLQEEALATMTALADELCFEMSFEPGDIQLLHNHVMLHSRAGYDEAGGQRARHLLRLWLATPGGRPLPQGLIERYGVLGPGGRPAGIIVEGTEIKAPLEAE